jgi:hypothetical protein
MVVVVVAVVLFAPKTWDDHQSCDVIPPGRMAHMPFVLAVRRNVVAMPQMVRANSTTNRRVCGTARDCAGDTETRVARATWERLCRARARVSAEQPQKRHGNQERHR